MGISYARAYMIIRTYKRNGHKLKTPEEAVRKVDTAIKDPVFRDYLVDRLEDWKLETLVWRVHQIEVDWGLKISRWTLSNWYALLDANKLKAATKKLTKYSDQEMLLWQQDFCMRLQSLKDQGYEVLLFDESSTDFAEK